MALEASRPIRVNNQTGEEISESAIPALTTGARSSRNPDNCSPTKHYQR